MSNDHTGQLIAIHTAAERGEPMLCPVSAEAVVGRGLIGDRYHNGRGTFSGRTPIVAGGRALSLIDDGTLAVCRQRLGWDIPAAALRRNLLVEGLDLQALRGRELSIGEVRIRLLGRCPPCGYLDRLLHADMCAALHGLGGMRARIVRGGVLTTGDPVHIICPAV